MSTLDDLAEVGKIDVESVTIKGKTFHVCSLNSAQRAALQRALQEGGQIPEYVTLAHGLCNKDGTPLGQFDDIVTMLKTLKGTVVSELCDAVYRASALDKPALETAEKKS